MKLIRKKWHFEKLLMIERIDYGSGVSSRVSFYLVSKIHL